MTNLASTAETNRNTIWGGVAILFWSTTIAFSRSLTEQLGTLTAATGIYLVAGLAGLLIVAIRPGGFAMLRRLPRLYLLGCGALFVAYILLLYLSVGFAATRTQVLAVGLINYLWPAFSLVFAVPLLKQRAGPFLPAGILIALIGIWLATTSGLSLQELLQEPGSLLPYGLSLLAAVCWGLYSNLSRRWAAGNDGGGVPLFLLASGLLLGVLRLLSPETSQWSSRALFEMAYMALFPGMLAYVLWDMAVRKGEIILVAALSYLTPLLSTIFSSLILNVRPGGALWLGAGLVIAGAVISRFSVTNPT